VHHRVPHAWLLSLGSPQFDTTGPTVASDVEAAEPHPQH
jgi:hypothetical protein